MKLLRLKITDPAGFRSLPCDFEHHFRTEWTLQDELGQNEGFAPFVCAGPNGSGKSNLLEVLAAIFFQLEVQRVRRNFLPEALDEMEGQGAPRAFELEYLISLQQEDEQDGARYAHLEAICELGGTPRLYWRNFEEFGSAAQGLSEDGLCGELHREFLLPEFVIGYSSGENEILSLPFFKLRFVQFDEYRNSLRTYSQYPGRPDARLLYMDGGFSQAVLLCNLLFQEEHSPPPYLVEIGIEALKEFRIVLRRSIVLDEAQAESFMAAIYGSEFETREAFNSTRPVLTALDDSGRYRLDILRLLEEKRPEKANHSSLALDALRRCATLEYHDESSDTLVLDYWVNAATRLAFQDNFGGQPRALFQAFQVLLILNLYAVSEELKTDLYRSQSDYVSETVPTLASDERVMRFKFVRFKKHGAQGPITLKGLSDGEHQLLHSLGMCQLFRGTDSLFLLDEPETHFNPDWRASFISRLKQVLDNGGKGRQEMLITTHSPFLISDSTPDKVLLFEKDAGGVVGIDSPDYNTLGASINKITMTTFGKRETVGGLAQSMLQAIRERFERGENVSKLVDELDSGLGDSLEKVLLIKSMLAAGNSSGTGTEH